MMANSRWLESQITGALWGAVAGDALGVPVEFKSREHLQSAPVTDMQGYGSHDQPAGTWSDDSSLILCTMESLLECNGLDTKDMAGRFLRWLRNARWTPYGEVFDIGIATRQALARFAEGKPPERCGGREEFDNGNGSLMRILPVVLWFTHVSTRAALEATHQVSMITHAHPRSQMVCGFYTLLVRALIAYKTPREALEEAWWEAEAFYATHEEFQAEWPKLARMHPEILPSLPEDEIQSSGYCVHTLEASMWCLLHHDSYSAAVLHAVNLGEDTDTTGSVTGALAGLQFGFTALPETWLQTLARQDDLSTIIGKFSGRIAPL